MGLERVQQEGRRSRSCVDGDHCADRLAPVARILRAGFLADLLINHGEVDRLPRQLVRRINAQCGNEQVRASALFGSLLSERFCYLRPRPPPVRGWRNRLKLALGLKVLTTRMILNWTSD